MSAPEDAAELAARLGAALGHRFADRGLALAALTHRSFANERGLEGHNERLEFLGDAVLGLLAAEWLFRRYPERPEGELSRAKSTLVSAGALARWAERLALGEMLRLGVGESRSGGSRKSSLLADAFEAALGALFLDGGPDAARRAVEPFLAWAEAAHEPDRRDAKTELQERLQAAGRALPVYEVVEESGPDHDKWFVCQVTLDGETLGRGSGRTKKEAHQRAAAAALVQLGPPAARFATGPPGRAGDGGDEIP
jgi:ribonuclease-3